MMALEQLLVLSAEDGAWDLCPGFVVAPRGGAQECSGLSEEVMYICYSR